MSTENLNVIFPIILDMNESSKDPNLNDGSSSKPTSTFQGKYAYYLIYNSLNY